MCGARFRGFAVIYIFTIMSSSIPPQTVEARLRERFPSHLFPEVVSLYLFGSEAKGAAHRDSDVDIGVLTDRDLAPSRDERSDLRVRLGSELIAVTGRNEVDVAVLNDVPPGLARAIVTGGVRVYCRDEEADRSFVRDTLLRAADLDPFLRRMREIKLRALLT